MRTYNFHPLAICWAKPDNYEDIKTSIKEVGQLEPIDLFEDQILDGVQRYQICGELGIEPRFQVVNPPDPMAYVLAKNKHRRHQTKGQIAMAVAKMSKLQHGSNQYVCKSGSVVTKDPLTRSQIAESAGISKSELERAQYINENGSGEIITAVSTGQISADKGRIIAHLPKEEQAEALAKAPPKRKAKQPKKKQHRVSSMAELRERSAAIFRGKSIGVTKEEFDPEFKGTHQDFIDHYGHVQLWTKKEYEASNDKVAFSNWVGAIRDLREPLTKYLEAKPFKPENFEAWLKRGNQPEKRRSEMQELASMIVRAKESIEWLVNFLKIG